MRRIALIVGVLLAFAAPVSVYSGLTPPAVGTPVCGSNTCTVSWTNPAECEAMASCVIVTENVAWVIERCTGAGCTNFAALATTLPGATNYVDNTVVNGNVYQYRIEAYPYSNTVSGAPSSTSTTTTSTTTTVTTLTATTTTSTTTTLTTTSSTTTTITTTTLAGATTTTTTLLATLQGFIPAVGAVSDIVLSGSTAYVASPDFGLSIVNVTSPAAPTVTGAADRPFYGDSVAVSGSTAVVGSSRGALTVLDISTPSHPHVVGQVAGSPAVKSVAMSGTTAYAKVLVAGSPGHIDLWVIDCAVPSAPVVATTITLAGGQDVDVVGTKLYVGGGTNGLKIYDITSPLAPALLGTFAGASDRVAVLANTAYVTQGNVVTSVNVTDPANPVQLGTVTLAQSPGKIVATGTRLYGANALSLYILDVTNPSTMQLLAALTGYTPTGVAANLSTVYLGSSQVNRSTGATGGFWILDTTTPSSPVVRSHILGGLDNEDVAATATLAVAAGRSSDGGLQIVDISTPTAPVVRARMAGEYRGVAITGTTIYARKVVVANPSHFDLVVINASTPTAPVQVSQTFEAGGSSTKVVGSRLYVAGGSSGLQVFDISSPLAPVLLGTFATSTSAMAASSANFAYLVTGTTLIAVNATTPSAMVQTSSISNVGTVLDVEVVGTKLFTINNLTFSIYDISTPGTLTLLGTGAPRSSQGLQGIGTRAFLTGFGTITTPELHAFNVVDVTNPAAQALLQSVIVAGNSKSAAVVGTSQVVTGDSASVLDVWSIGP